jgi:serine protease Do
MSTTRVLLRTSMGDITLALDGTKAPLTVQVPKAPTGEVANAGSSFVVSNGSASGPARFIWATEEGKILGWNPSVMPTQAVVAVDRSSAGAVFKGLAIASTTGGSVGVGFAIPSNMARTAMTSLLKTGRVIRGFLAATTQDVTPLLAKVFHLPDVKGALITDVMAKGSAEKAGLRRGDVITKFDGRDVLDSGRLQNVIGSAPIGSRHRLDVVRDGKSEQVELVVQEAPRERKTTQPRRMEPAEHPLASVAVEEIRPAVARQLGVGSAGGVIVSGVDEGSAADAAGLQQGDLILELNRHHVNNLATYQRLVESIRPKDIALLLINRQGTMAYIPIATE